MHHQQRLRANGGRGGTGLAAGSGPVSGGHSPLCAHCRGQLLPHPEEPIVMALGQQWHCDCFRCSVCEGHLHNWYFEREGLLYCREDYYGRFGDACQQCMAVITGPVMVAGEHKFHPECFCCTACGSFIGEGESYALVERSKLYCGQCYGKRSCQPADDKARITTAGKPMHSIRLVEIPKDATPGLRVDGVALDDGCPTVRITDLFCNFFLWLTSMAEQCCGAPYRIDVNLTNLHIGDRILEVNGTPVSDSSVEQIDKLIRSNEKMLQLTVEHDPVQVCRSCSQADIQRAMSASTLILPLSTSASSVEVGRERLYKTPGEQGTKARKLRQATNASTTIPPAAGATAMTQLKEKERCSSLSKLLDEQHQAQQHSAHPQLYDLSRTQSCRVVQKPQRIFRASDLVIGEKLGEGFFGKVFKVTHRQSGEVMVLKELHRADEEAQRNFIKEVAVLRLLDHRHVLKFIGVLYKDKKLHMVTEYVAGGCLKELIHDPAHVLPWPQRVCLARDIACGMSYLHSMNIIHRDLNSMNCLVREDRSVIVADFGLARSVDAPRLPSGNMTPGGYVSGANSDAPMSPSGTLRRSKSRQRRQRYTVVGNPYWMAPEMMKGLKYDEKVDVFSFGIMLCEIIGRVEADPDFMPRNSDFSLNQQEFREKFCAQCPEPFVKVAFVCCDLNPDLRPCFETLHVWLLRLADDLAADRVPPQRLLHEIETFHELYASSEDALSPTSQRSLNNLYELVKSAVDSKISPVEKENLVIKPQDIPKSPHLGKDFSPSGERLRDSMRARRRQRFLGAQEERRNLTPDTESKERALKKALKKCRPFGERGYLVDLRAGAELQLEDVRDLNTYSDVDSSCDTSLNYHDVNNLPAAQEDENAGKPGKAELLDESTNKPNNQESQHHRLAIDDMRTRLNQCRSKFEHLEEASRRNFNQSQHSMKNFFKTPPVALKMFQRLEHEAAALNGGNNCPPPPPRTQRINQTPIFGRKNPPVAIVGQKLQHAESLEDLASSGVAKQLATPAPKRSKATATTKGAQISNSSIANPPLFLPPSINISVTLNSNGNVTTTTNTTSSCPPSASDWLPKKHKLTLPLSSVQQQRTSSNLRQPLGNSKGKTLKPLPSRTGTQGIPPSNCVSPTRSSRPGSPSKHLAQRHTAATAQRLTNVAATHQQQHQQQSSKTTRLNILSPEKVHRLGARLTDQKQKMREEAAATASSVGGAVCAAGTAAGSLNGHRTIGSSGTPNSAVGERRRRAAPPPPVRTHFNTRC
ncbi:LIM domain kinase 1 isoform X1 [Drosophila sechellia]|uniref:LIM domain kinase 1 isoform X1 n=1 Tax=Drosophila sechellia TaxID=7238 RepID=UPI0013DD962F|nr:LIM domain kinase 1 isoform X1 [Drosophila sechellia]XP_032580376.1 LIM domain kinase 1 isoform X1 [Drosophila sechellia]